MQDEAENQAKSLNRVTRLRMMVQFPEFLSLKMLDEGRVLVGGGVWDRSQENMDTKGPQLTGWPLRTR